MLVGSVWQSAKNTQVKIQRAKHARKPVVSVSNTVKARTSKPLAALEIAGDPTDLQDQVVFAGELHQLIGIEILQIARAGRTDALGSGVDLPTPAWSHPHTPALSVVGSNISLATCRRRSPRGAA